jgi:hypothetical protein
VLTELLDENKDAKDRSAKLKCDMCAETLLQRVYLPHDEVGSASLVLEQYGASLSEKTREVCAAPTTRWLCM